MESKTIIQLCQKMDDYKGIERHISVAKFPKKKNFIENYLSMADENGEIVFSHDSWINLLEIKKVLYSIGVFVDVIVCSEKETDITKKYPLQFLGFDISGDSFYHSPLFRSVFQSPYSANFQDVHNQFSNYLNKNGLFSDMSDAKKFIQYIQENNKGNVFENDKNIRPIMIFGEE